MAERRFCASCGEQVDTYPVVRNNRTEVCCVFCGLVVEAEQPPEIGRAERVIVADDSELVRNLLVDCLLSKRLAVSVRAVADGAAFLETAARWLREATPPSLVILDINMPGLEGFGAASALRAAERAFDVGLPAPILFVTAQKADAALQEFLKAHAPAHYINKASAASPEQLSQRVEALVRQMLQPTGALPTPRA